LYGDIYCYTVYVKILNPHDVLKEFGVYGAEDVADVGTGYGHFALAAAKRLDGGRLFAIDVERDMLKRLVDEATRMGIGNLHALCGDAARLSGIPLGDAAVDKAIAASVLFQIHDRDAFVQELKRIVRPGGKVLLVDWKGGHNDGAHHAHKVGEDATRALFARHGFALERGVETGDLHYGMIFVRA